MVPKGTAQFGFGQIAADRNRSGYGRSVTITYWRGGALLNFIDVDGRVVPGSERKRHAADNQLQCVASVGRKRDL